MPSLASVATTLEAHALTRAYTWSDEARQLVVAAEGASRDVPTLGAYLDDHAAVFAVHGDGPVATRRLEPLTYLASHVANDDVTMRRISAVLSSIDDLPANVDLRRVGFATTDQASAGLGLLGDLRLADPIWQQRGGREAIDGVVEMYLPNTKVTGSATGYYQHERGELVLSPRVSRQVLHAGFEDPTSPLPELPPANAARIPPHELVHGTQPHDLELKADPVWDRTAEGAASIVGNLRSGTTLRAIGRDVVGVEELPMRSQYNPFSNVLSGLARLGGQNLDEPTHVARFERRIAELSPPELIESLSADAARWQGASASDIRDAAEAGLLHGPARFEAQLAAMGVAVPDTSLGWMFTEARRRAGVTTAA